MRRTWAIFQGLYTSLRYTNSGRWEMAPLIMMPHPSDGGSGGAAALNRSNATSIPLDIEEAY